jgi:hypothetical protein
MLGGRSVGAGSSEYVDVRMLVIMLEEICGGQV